MPGGNFLALTMASVTAVWLVALLLIILFSVVSGRLSLRGLQTDPTNKQVSVFSCPQMLLLALSGAVTYLATGVSAIGTTSTLPAVSTEVLPVVGDKAIAAILSRFKSLRGMP